MATDELIISEGRINEVIAPRQAVEIVVINRDQEIVIEGTAGPQGAPGTGIPAGGTTGQYLKKKSNTDYDLEFVDTTSADAYFTQDFLPATTVTITHNLGKYPAVTVKTSAGDVVIGDIEYLNVNQVQLSFASAFGGSVICN